MGPQYPDSDTVGSSGTPILYDPAGRLKTVPNLLTTALYNARGHATSLTLGILGSGPRTAVTTNTYSAARGWQATPPKRGCIAGRLSTLALSL